MEQEKYSSILDEIKPEETEFAKQFVYEDQCEYWVQCPYPYSSYEASNLGRIRTKKNGHIMEPRFNESGYYRVHVTKDDGVDHDARVHRIVCLTFHGEAPSPEHTDVNHINENKTDDRACNLEWMTRAENNAWGTRTERAASTFKEKHND